jgi:TolB-like protein/DNA-binding SARP family transcriptional activator/Tfp pilus assembly protein PilF
LPPKRLRPYYTVAVSPLYPPIVPRSNHALMLSLQLFGGFALQGDGGALSGRAAQKKRLAVLVLIGSTPTSCLSRDKVIALLWPEAGTSRARHQLSSSVYELRRALGEETIISTGDDLRLNPELVDVDVRAFRQALAAGDWSRAVELYAGPFLDGFYVADAPEFGRWADTERERHAFDFAQALERLAELRQAADDARGAVELWRRLAALDPCHSRVTLRLMHALDSAGDRAGAIQQAHIHATLLREDCGLEPAPEVTALVEQLRRPMPAARPGTAAERPEDVLSPPAEPGGVEPGGPADPEHTGLAADERPAPNPPATTPGRVRRGPARRAVAFVSTLLLVLVAGLASWAATTAREPATDARAASIAVLPFVDMTPDADAAFFGDGLAEELIHALGQVQGLRVVARTSAFTFRDRAADVRQIGDALDVGAVLEGSVRRSGEQVNVTVKLVDTRTGFQLWSGRYQRPMADMLAVQEEIARAVVGALEPALLPRADDVLVARSTQSAEAYQLYMQGRYFWNQRSEAGLHRAVERFEAAIRVDPRFAAAYTGLSDAHNSLADNGYVPSEPALQRAEAAVRTALELAPGLAEAYSSRGHLRLHRWDWAGAERDFHRAIELNPGYAVAHQYYAFLLTFQGRFDEALARIVEAQQLDPLSLAVQNNVGEVQYLARRYPAAAAQLSGVLQMDPARHDSRTFLAATLIELGRAADAIVELERLVAEGGGWHRTALPILGHAYHHAGRAADAAAVAARLDAARAAGRLAAPVAYAGLLGELGRADDAFAVLEHALATMPSVLVTAGVSPRIDALRGDARFPRFLRRIGLEAQAR